MASEPAPDWLHSLTRPFDDNPELQLAAQQQLASQAADADPARLAPLAARFDAIDAAPSGQRQRRRRLTLALAAILTLAAVILCALPYLKVRRISQSLGSTFYPAETHAKAEAMRPLLTPEAHFTIYGDTTQPTGELAARALWQTDPDNPVLFNHYLNHCDPFPDDLLDTANRIDPGNGWFLLTAAGELGAESVEKKRRPWSGPREERPVVADWAIKDPDDFQQALALIKKAAAMPRMERYDPQHLRHHFILLPPERDFPSRVVRLIHAASTPSSGIFKSMHCSKILSTHIYLRGQAGDTEALGAIIPTVESLCRQLNQSDGLLIQQLVAQAVCQSTYEHLLEACEHNNMTTEANRLRPVVMALRAERKAQRTRDYGAPDLVRKRAGTMTGLAAGPLGRFGNTPPTLAEMKPGRLVDYALADRVSLLAAAILLLLAIPATLVIPRLQGTLPARIGKRFALLPDHRDRWWILGLGTALPLAWLLAITRLTPLGGRDWNITFFLFQPIGSQYIFAFLLVIAATLQAVRWRLGIHAASLGIGSLPGKRGLLPVILLALAIPVAGLLPITMSMVPVTIGITLAALATLWLLFLVIRSIPGRRRNPHRAAVAATLPGAFAGATFLLLALVPLTVLAERHWIARDSLGRTSPESLGMGRLEIEATQALQATLRQALDAKPSPNPDRGAGQ